MPILNEKFGFTVRDNTTGSPLTGALVELRENSNNYVLTEVGTSGFYEIASIPTGKYSVYINSVNTNGTMAVGAGQIAALGNEIDNIPVSTTDAYEFQTPSGLKLTLELDQVSNVAIPIPTGADTNKIITVDFNGDYQLIDSTANPDLQIVTDVGAVTTNDLTVGTNLVLSDGNLNTTFITSTGNSGGVTSVLLSHVGGAALNITNFLDGNGSSLFGVGSNLTLGAAIQSIFKMFLNGTDVGTSTTGMKMLVQDPNNSNEVKVADLVDIPTSLLDGAFVLKNSDGSYVVTDNSTAPSFRYDSVGGQFLLDSAQLRISSPLVIDDSGIINLDDAAGQNHSIYTGTDKLIIQSDGAGGLELQSTNGIVTGSAVDLNGVTDTQSGQLLANDPTQDQQVATKKYVDDNSIGGSAQLDSTGIKSASVISVNADSTKWDLGIGEAYVMDYSDPTNIVPRLVSWTAQSALIVSNLLTDPRTNVAISLTNAADSGVTFGNSFTGTIDGVSGTIYIAEKSSDNFTSEQLRKYAQIGRLVHSNQTNLSFVVPLQRHTESVLSTALTFIDLFPAQNVEGNAYSPTTGVNLSVDKSVGKGFRIGSNYETNLLNPDIQDIPAASPTTHDYRYQDGSGGWTDTTASTVLDPTKWDDGSGTLQNVQNNRWTAQAVFVFAGSGSMFIQPGQQIFSAKSAAIEALATIDPVLDPNLTDDAIFRGWFVVRSGGTDTNDSNDFEWRAPLSERGGGTGTAVVVDLQTAYDNSMNPEILTDSSRNALTIKQGSGADTDNVLEVQNGAGTNTFEVNGDGDLTANSLDVGEQATIKTTGGNSILLVGDDTTTVTNNLTGFRVLARETDGDIYLDHKTKSGKLIRYRCGEGAESASSHIFMQIDPTDGEITFANVNEISDMGLISLRDTSNSSSSDGDFWKEGDFNLLKGETRVIGGTSATLHVGDDVNLTTNGQSGIKLQSDSVGHINVDHKTKNSEEIRYRCGANSETGFARTFMEVDPTTGGVSLPNLPTSSAGLSAGALWNDSGTLKIV